MMAQISLSDEAAAIIEISMGIKEIERQMEIKRKELLQLFAKKELLELSRARISGVPSGHTLTKPRRFRP